MILDARLPTTLLRISKCIVCIELPRVLCAIVRDIRYAITNDSFKNFQVFCLY